MNRSFIASLIVMLSLAGCAVQNAQTAAQAKTQMVGLTKEEVLECMGIPASKMKEGKTEVWAYNSGGSTFGVASTFGQSNMQGNAYGTPAGANINAYSTSTAVSVGHSHHRYCIVNVVFNHGKVTTLNYVGRTGGIVTKGAECSYAVAACVKG